jgi:choloylglycine hydrolase
MIEKQDTLLVGHNLDDYYDVIGSVIVNKRGIKKQNFEWGDFTCMCAKKRKAARIDWISKYGSITYNTWGKEFLDGGMNEKGLYIGEMTMMATEWPETDKPTLHHHFFMQYILDNCADVPEVFQHLEKIGVNGHCKWHYFVADRSGNSAVLEFYKDGLKIYTGETMPVKVLCNRSYQRELDLNKEYAGQTPESLEKDYYDKDLRSPHTNKMIDAYHSNSDSRIIDYAFSVLKKMDFGNNRWQVVYDLKNMDMYFRTSKGQKIKFLSFSNFDFGADSPGKIFDINSDAEGDVSGLFSDYSEAVNKDYVDRAFAEINFGFFGNLMLKKRYQTKINTFANSFKPE